MKSFRKRSISLAAFFLALALPAISLAASVTKNGTVYSARSYNTNQTVLCFTPTGTTSQQCFIAPTASANAMLAVALTALSATKNVSYIYDSASPTLLTQLNVLQ